MHYDCISPAIFVHVHCTDEGLLDPEQGWVRWESDTRTPGTMGLTIILTIPLTLPGRPLSLYSLSIPQTLRCQLENYTTFTRKLRPSSDLLRDVSSKIDFKNCHGTSQGVEGVEYTIKMQTFHRMNEVSCERLGCVGMTEWGLRTRSITHWCQSLGARPEGPGLSLSHPASSWHCSIIPLSSHFITSDVGPDLISIMANLNIHGGSAS